MNEDDIIDLFAEIHRADKRREFDEQDVRFWLGLGEHAGWTRDAALRAVTAHAAENKGWISPADITAYVRSMPTDPRSALARLREQANGHGAAAVVGRPYLPKAQPPSDRTPGVEWDRREALRFIDEHEDHIMDCLVNGGPR